MKTKEGSRGYYSKVYAKWLVKHAYLKSFLVTMSMQCCWRQVLIGMEFQRLKQQASETTIILIKDSRTNLLEKRRNDTVQLISHERPSILFLSLMERPFGKDCVFSWNLACVPFGHDEFLA